MIFVFLHEKSEEKKKPNDEHLKPGLVKLRSSLDRLCAAADRRATPNVRHDNIRAHNHRKMKDKKRSVD